MNGLSTTTNGIVFAPTAIPTPDELDELESLIRDTESPETLAQVLREKFGVTDEHTKFLIEQGKARKLREFFFEVLLFDLQNGTSTSAFISEASYQELATKTPSLFTGTENVPHGVKHRASLTNSVVEGFSHAVRIMNEHGINPKQASLFDLGCGTGKPLLIGMSPEFTNRIGSTFKRAVGVDYYQNVLDVAEKNTHAQQLRLEPRIKIPNTIRWEFSDAAKFRDFNGVNVVYMYNPFDREVMRKVEHNLRNYGGKTIVVYNKPLYAQMFKERGWEVEHEISHREKDELWTADKRTIILSYGYRDLPAASGPT